MKRFIRQIRDKNHKLVCDYLKAHGIEVIETFHPLDALVFHKGLAGWIEIKTTARDAHIRRSQIEFMSATGMPVAFVRTPDEALQFARDFRGLTSDQKTNLAIFLRTATKETYGPAVIERVLEWI